MNLAKFTSPDRSILILSSIPLDWDSLASGLILKKYLESLGKQVQHFFPRPFTQQERQAHDFLPYFPEIKDQDSRPLFKSRKFDLLVLVDGGNLDQFYDTSQTSAHPPDLSLYPRRLHIDHHQPSGEQLGTHSVHKTQVSSTTELILSQLIPSSFIDPRIATLGYAGIADDTGNFKWNIFPSTLQLASLLLEQGADYQLLIDRFFFSHPKDYFSMFAYAIEHTQYFPALGTSILALPYSQLQADHINQLQLALLKDAFKESLARCVTGFPRGILLVENKSGKISLSARGNNLHNQLNLPQFFSHLGYQGGGHFNACGFDVESTNLDQVKSQILAALKPTLHQTSTKSTSKPVIKPVIHDSSSKLHIHTDGASRGNPGPAAAAFVIQDPQNRVIHQSGKFLNTTTNNIAEYTAVLLALQWLHKDFLSTRNLKLETLNFSLDSQLIVRQLTGRYKIKQPHLKQLAIQIMHLVSQIKSRGVTVKFNHVVRSQNHLADRLANQILDQHSSKSS
jgi:ribonuclease HI